MTNFDYKKFLKENKSTFHSSLNEAELSALELDQVKNISQQVADEFTKAETKLDLRFSTSPDSVEASPKGAGFDLDVAAGPNTPGDEWKDEKGFGIENYIGKFAGGSYVIKSEEGKHKIYNAAAQNAYIGYVTPEGEVVFEYEKSMEEAKEAPKSNKMKKSELKELIKASFMNEMTLDIDNTQSEEDFLAEVESILAEESEFDTNKPARVAEFLKALDALVDEYHAELYLSDNISNAIEMVKKAAKDEIGLNEADEEVDAETADVAVDTPEGGEDIEVTDTETTAEVDPNVKATQDALTQAMEAAKAIGDKKLQDQIGNTITFFTRTHVANAATGAMAEADEMEEGKKEYYNDAEADDAEHIKALEKDMKDDKDSSLKLGEIVFPMWQRINK
jgi:hypothetical protein